MVEDQRPRWDDPNLPVFGKSGRPIDPSKMVIKANLELMNPNHPSYREDPTYNLRRKK